MASIDDSPTSLHGQPWSVWADRLGRDSPLSDTDEQSKINATKEGDAMKLPKQDMHYYGLCPVRDEFYLVTCNYCQRVYTPQGLKNHIELKHAQEWTNCQQLQLNESGDSGIQLSSAGPATTANAAKSKTSKKAVSGQAPAPNSLAYLLATPAAPLKSRGPAGNKRVAIQTGKPASSTAAVVPAAASVVSHGPANAKIPAPVSSALTGTSYDKVPSPQQPPPVQFSPLQPTITAPSPKSPLTASAVGGTMTPSPAITMTVAVDSSGNQTVQIHLPEIGNGVMLADSPTDLANSAANTGSSNIQNRTGKKQRKGMKAERRGIPGKERELDLEKHCGVWIGDVHRACTRSLTCKAHSLTLRRAVQGRSRAFDDLLAEHRAAKEVMLKQLKDGATPPVPTSQPPVKTNPVVASQPTSSLPKLGRPPITRPPPAKKPFTALTHQQQQQQQQQHQQHLHHHHHHHQQQQQFSSANELTIEVPTGEGSTQQLPSSGLLQRVIPSAVAPLSLTFSSHHPKPLAVCSFGLKRQLNGAVIANDRKWDFIRTTLRSAFQRPATASTGHQTATAPTLHSILNSSTLRSVSTELGQLESNTIQLPNGLHLSIGDQLTDLGRHQDAKANLLNGVTGADQVEATLEDLMEGFDGLVGEDGVLTFLNQTTEGSASLSLMADLSAGNITFSELNQSNTNPAGNGNGARMLSSAAVAGLLLHPDTGDPL